MERFNLKNLNNVVKISNRFATLENLGGGGGGGVCACVDINRAWERIRI